MSGPSQKNPARRAAAFALPTLFLLAGAVGCSDLAAQESKDPAPAPQQKQDDPKAAGAPAPAVTPPQGTRPIDEGAIKALASELAQLRAELAALRQEKAERTAEAGGDGANGGDAPPQQPLVEEVPRVGTAAGGVAQDSGGSGSQSGSQNGDQDRDDGPTSRAPERVVEREVIEREVPVYVETVIENTIIETIERPSVEVRYVYEDVYYGGVTCRQHVPFAHVHSIGCGHHYYGCACHPWYYDLHDHGVSLNFTFIDVDHDHHGTPGRYRAGYRNGYRTGFTDGDRDDRRDGRANDPVRVGGTRNPSAPSRPLDDTPRGNPSRPGRQPSGVTAGLPVSEQDRGTRDPIRVGGEVASEPRTPRDGVDRSGSNRGQGTASRDTRSDDRGPREPVTRAPRDHSDDTPRRAPPPPAQPDRQPFATPSQTDRPDRTDRGERRNDPPRRDRADDTPRQPPPPPVERRPEPPRAAPERQPARQPERQPDRQPNRAPERRERRDRHEEGK